MEPASFIFFSWLFHTVFMAHSHGWDWGILKLAFTFLPSQLALFLFGIGIGIIIAADRQICMSIAATYPSASQPAAKCQSLSKYKRPVSVLVPAMAMAIAMGMVGW